MQFGRLVGRGVGQLGSMLDLEVMVVNFAMTRVVAALFLKQTLEVAAKERERVANDAKTKKDKMAKRLRDVFKLADDTGDGCVELAEFQQMLDEPEVRETLESMELNHHEVRALVELLSGGERPVPILDFLHAALTMHEQAKTIHLMQASMDIAKVEREVLSIGAKQNALLKRLGMAAEIAAL
ncbi:unnamed protein product [Effrenium voratum]|uniref:EF-hand domain-containing protein n=1 Tax=Effrenium voratum TaxID=2562239 RepID=A0AA36MP21_9DINO|nr:unnamed protein product [Effrenium voratum]